MKRILSPEIADRYAEYRIVGISVERDFPRPQIQTLSSIDDRILNAIAKQILTYDTIVSASVVHFSEFFLVVICNTMEYSPFMLSVEIHGREV